jgi:hypothetical protein
MHYVIVRVFLGVVVAVSIMLLAITIAYSGKALVANTADRNQIVADVPRYDLAVTTQIKNDSDIIEEWIEHYIDEGATFIGIRDDHSDSGNMNKLIGIVERQRSKHGKEVTIEVTKTTQGTKNSVVQAKTMEYFAHRLRKSVTWIAFFDSDEYAWAPSGGSLRDHLMSDAFKKAGIVHLPWIMFGSNGHITQPKSVRESFVCREELRPGLRTDGPAKPTPGRGPGLRQDPSLTILTKSIVRTSCIDWNCPSSGPHSFNVADLQKTDMYHTGGSGTPVQFDILMNIDHESAFDPRISDTIVLHHYRVMSKERFLTNKGGSDKTYRNVSRNLELFDVFEKGRNAVLDERLAKRTRERRTKQDEVCDRKTQKRFKSDGKHGWKLLNKSDKGAVLSRADVIVKMSLKAETRTAFIGRTNRERVALQFLNDHPETRKYVPKLIEYGPGYIVMSNAGNPITKANIPQDWKKQLNTIHDSFQLAGVVYLDWHIDNIVEKDGNLFLIDHEYTAKERDDGTLDFAWGGEAFDCKIKPHRVRTVEYVQDQIFRLLN